MKRVAFFSGGVGSWAAAKRVVTEHGVKGLTLLFTDTREEDADLYRFIHEAASDVGATLVRAMDGRNPWEVFRDRKFLGNTRVDLCSRILKREVSERWLRENCDPAETTCYVGIDWTEEHRFTELKTRWGDLGWTFRAPLCEAPFLSKDHHFKALTDAGIRMPRLYELGFAHNNCGGGCVKAGQAHFAHLLQVLPDRYARWETKEAEARAFLGKDVAILRDRRGGTTKPLPLDEFRRRIQCGGDYERDEFGGCGCFSGPLEGQ